MISLPPVDVCIVGTGAGGGILADSLVKAGLRVLSLEQGAPITDDFFTNQRIPADEDFLSIAPNRPWPGDASTAFFYDNARAFQLYATDSLRSSDAESQARFDNLQIFRLNGKQNLWGGTCLRYSPRDFRSADFGDGDINWPIDYQELEPHYSEVEKLIGVCGTQEGIENLPDGIYHDPPPLRPADLLLRDTLQSFRGGVARAIPNRKAVETRDGEAAACQSCGFCCYGCSSGSVYKFSSRLLPDLITRPNYEIRYCTKVIRLIRKEHSQRIDQLECLDTQTGEEFQVSARIFVLCAGAMETPRILMNSMEERFPRGLANSSGLLGCYLQDNVKVGMGSVLRRLIYNRSPYQLGFGDNMLIPRFQFNQPEYRGGFQGQFVHVIPRRPFYLTDLGFVPNWIKPRIVKRIFKAFVAILFQGTPEAVKANRVVLGPNRDQYGVRQLSVQHRWTDNDLRLQAAMAEWGTAVLKACSGLTVKSYLDEIAGKSIHYAGTCRMSEDPQEGIVDANLMTFDHPNLFICDGSVFPQISEKNLTLTIMALAHRLGKHLELRIKRTHSPLKLTSDC